MKITVVGSGFVGLANAILLAQHNPVTILDIDKRRVEKINSGISPIKDKDIEYYLAGGITNLKGTTCKYTAYKDSDYIVIAVPTDYDPETNYFNTSIIKSVVRDIQEYNAEALVVIKSTIPIGYTRDLRKTMRKKNIIFSPEFLREGTALYDNLYPSRIIVGSNTEEAQRFGDLLKEGSHKEPQVLYTGSTEAEAIKLFSNGYLAMRVAFFNEVDSYCMEYGLDSTEVISGMSKDPRIGDYYNNPSFGYGGYCFPKDTKQLKANFEQVPHSIVSAIVESNEVRKKYLVDEIMMAKPKVIGVYRLVMKEGSDNFRSSAVFDIITQLKDKGCEIVVYEPYMDNSEEFTLENDLEVFKKTSDIVIANRVSDDILDIQYKVFTRDIFNKDT